MSRKSEWILIGVKKDLTEELIVTQKKLEIAVKALEEIIDASDNYRFCQSVGYKSIADEALKQIKEVADEQEE